MGSIREVLESFKNLFDIEYEFVLGRKGKNITLTVNFQKRHFFHIAGLQHLKDLPRIAISAEKVFDKIESGKISAEYIESSQNYEFIRARIDFIPRLQEIFDSNDTIFKYNPALQAFSVIEADFLMKNEMVGTRLFTFLSKSPDGSYFCRSFFPDNKKDYAERQTNWTVLFKKKRCKSSGAEEVLFRYKQYNASATATIGML